MCFAPQPAAIFDLSSAKCPPLYGALLSILRRHKTLAEHSVSRLFCLFLHFDLLSSCSLFSDFSLHCCCICLYVGSLTSKLPSLIKHDHLHAENTKPPFFHQALRDIHANRPWCPQCCDVLREESQWSAMPSFTGYKNTRQFFGNFSRNQSSKGIPEYPTQCIIHLPIHQRDSFSTKVVQICPSSGSWISISTSRPTKTWFHRNVQSLGYTAIS